MNVGLRTVFGMMVAVLCLLVLPAYGATGQPVKPDPWEPLRILVGDWVGSAEGQSGAGTVRRTYSFVLKDRYLYETNISTYPPQEKNKNGETHEHWSLFSYDRIRNTLVLRQFHQEGFVNQYVMNAAESRPGKVVFDSEHFENFDNTWEARETYEIRSVDEFIETFELGAPGKKLEVYSRNHFKRYKGQRCADNPQLADLTKKYGILVLCAAAGAVAGADSACAATLGPDWETFEPEDLAERTPREKVAVSLDWVCGMVLSLPTGKDTDVIKRLGAWCAVYKLIESLVEDGSVEALADAVVQVPALADLLSDAVRRVGGNVPVGDTLASAEHTELRYALARRLAGMPEDEMSAALLDLSKETTKAAKEEE